jgi:mannose-6-phosphate isomerase-like protein (cupin superfamily)
MAHRVVYGRDLSFVADPLVDGLSTALLVGESTGSVHLELALCELRPGVSTPPSRHAFEESWYVLAGHGTAAAADLTFEVGPGAFGVTPVAAPESKTAGPEGLRWLRVRAPQPRPADPRRGTMPATGWAMSQTPLTPSDTDPRSRWSGWFRETDMGAYGPLSMPGYHGPNIKSIFVRMLVDELLGARHHTLFMVEFGPRATQGSSATEHYHPFEEAYYLLAGSATGTLDGETVEVAAGDLVWTSVNGTHGFVNNGTEPVRWLEVQAPLPPASDAFFFPKDWDSLA